MSMNNSWKVKIWKNKSYVDLWSVNHFLAGVLLFGLSAFFDMGFWSGLIISLILMIVWEIYELLNNVIETKWNRFFDILLGTLGFLIFFFLNGSYLSRTGFFTVFICALVIWLTLQLWGYHAYKVIKKGI